MLRLLSILALSLLFLAGTQQTYASTYLMSYEKFVHLPKQERHAIVIKTMELMVELDAKYKYEVKTKGFDKTRFKKYTQLIEKFQSFLISSAHARAQWSAHRSNFSSLLGSQRDKCIYAGWISKLNSANLCVHPASLPRNAPERTAYQAESNCPGPSQISCNPVIFGFKKHQDQSLLCVPAGLANDRAHNSSKACMELAMSNVPDGDTAALRLEKLAEYLVADKAAAKEIYEFVGKACLCDNAPSGLNQRYQDYMRPHRTCYGLMNMMAESTKVCSEPVVEAQQTAIFTELRNSIAAANNNVPDADAFYRQFRQGIISSENLTNFCGAAQEGGGTEQGGTDDDGSEEGGDNDGDGDGDGTPDEETLTVDTGTTLPDTTVVNPDTTDTPGDNDGDGDTTNTDGDGNGEEDTTADPDANTNNEEVTGPGGYTISLAELTDATPATSKVGVATIKKNNVAEAGIPQGYKVVWARKGANGLGLDLPGGSTPASGLPTARDTEGPAASTTAEQPAATTTAQPAARPIYVHPESSDRIDSQVLTLTLVRHATTNYEICIVLLKDDNTIEHGGNCREVPKLAPATPVATPSSGTTGGFNPQQGPQMPTRGSSDTSARGIR